MLKAELETRLQTALTERDMSKELTTKLRDEIKILEARIIESDKHKKAKRKALIAIDAIISVECSAITRWDCLSPNFHDMEREGNPVPPRPDDKLYDALRHLEIVLSSPNHTVIDRGFR